MMGYSQVHTGLFGYLFIYFSIPNPGVNPNDRKSLIEGLCAPGLLDAQMQFLVQIVEPSTAVDISGRTYNRHVSLSFIHFRSLCS